MNISTIWQYDANTFKGKDTLLNLKYESSIVKEFLNHDSSGIVYSTKGWGKTFLLRLKSIKEQDDGTVCLPQDKHIDAFDGQRFDNLKPENIVYLSDYENTEDLWKIALITVIYKHLQENNHKDNARIRDIFKVSTRYKDIMEEYLDVVDWIPNACGIFAYLVYQDLEYIKNLTDMFNAFIIGRLSWVTEPVAYFIDTIDEAFECYLTRRSQDKNVWYTVQQGLVRAVLSISNENIRIFSGVRKEIFSRVFLGQSFTQVWNKLKDVKYNKNDMDGMLENYINLEKDDNLVHPMKRFESYKLAFFGFEELSLQSKNKYEDIFSYIYRHTFGRPRDLMQVCDEISKCNKEYREPIKVKTIINETSTCIAVGYFQSVAGFTHNFSIENLEDVLKIIPKNILSSPDLVSICSQYNKGCNRICVKLNKDGVLALTKRCINENNIKIQHPFCSLYNIGLMGIITTDIATGLKKQKFLMPGDSVENEHLFLPKSECYLIHPVLYQYIRNLQLRNRVEDSKMFEIDEKITVGNGLDWKNAHTVSWLHLSNIHFKKSKVAKSKIIEKSIRYVEKMIEENYGEKFDFIAVTGDILFQGDGQIHDIQEFLKKLRRQYIKEDGDIYIVPGNHDLLRSQKRTNFLKGYFRNKLDPLGVSLEKSQLIDALKEDFQKSEEEGKTFVDLYRNVKNELYPIDKCHFVVQKPLFNIIHINTCIFSGNEDEERLIDLDTEELEEVLKHADIENSKKLNIAIGHHSLSYFFEEIKTKMYEIFKKHNINFYLSGHNLEPNKPFDVYSRDKTFNLVCSSTITEANQEPGMIYTNINILNGKGLTTLHKFSGDTSDWVRANDVLATAENGVLDMDIYSPR